MSQLVRLFLFSEVARPCQYCGSSNVPADLACIDMCEDCCDEQMDGQIEAAWGPVGRWIVRARATRRRRRR